MTSLASPRSCQFSSGGKLSTISLGDPLNNSARAPSGARFVNIHPVILFPFDRFTD